MDVLIVNAGSASLKLAVYTVDGSGIKRCSEAHYDSDAVDPDDRIKSFLAQHSNKQISCVAHRVVHGGEGLTSSRIIDAAVEAEIDRLTSLAPLHNGAALSWIRACRTVLPPNLPQVAVFDTMFYASLPAVAKTYALPHELAERHGLRRYSFHGLAHKAMCQRWQALHPALRGGGRVISFQLGSGCSVTASEQGVARDSSMGFSPLEGLVMATRSGDVDPGLLMYLQRMEGLSAEDVENLLNHHSGLLGVSGVSGDMRKLLDSNEPRARLAIALYCYRARKYLGAYLAVLGGADAILFGGGVGENAAAVRTQILDGLAWAGIQLDAAANAATTGCEGRISTIDSRIQAWVIPVDEAKILAQEAWAVMSN